MLDEYHETGETVSCLSFYLLDQTQCLACCMTDGNNKRISQDPAQTPLLPGSSPWFSPSITTRCSLPLEPVILPLSSFVLERTVQVSALRPAVSLTYPVSLRLSHSRTTRRGSQASLGSEIRKTRSQSLLLPLTSCGLGSPLTSWSFPCSSQGEDGSRITMVTLRGTWQVLAIYCLRLT